ncbi:MULTISPECIES: PhaM family polyhydroxyalkanoate granule multifunctional regulatory protein [Caldimonas]|jgi:hypothetical protein|uniref:PhaM family polyhydroxyalkanoate granule multifunctional regulatory protein n=1 Tax=Caldimonas TaxID=196013 RepID=UPI000382CD8C|nr:PhaM family polyhydroxyalkanoate granule multifunctional regulatory protein [Caldimonas manganoxidans]
MSDPLQGLGQLVPGFDFLQGLVKNAGTALPHFSQWVAPTLNPEELDKRIEELRTVQFWLEQNARMLGATIQALEVQRMTLSTLKTMNVPVEALRESLMLRTPEAAAAAAEDASTRRPAAAKPSKAGKTVKSAAKSAAPSGAAASAVVDPLQWWGALTRQFTSLASAALNDAANASARQTAGEPGPASFSAAEDSLRNSGARTARAAAAAGSPTAPQAPAPTTGPRRRRKAQPPAR